MRHGEVDIVEYGAHEKYEGHGKQYVNQFLVALAELPIGCFGEIQFIHSYQRRAPPKKLAFILACIVKIFPVIHVFVEKFFIHLVWICIFGKAHKRHRLAEVVHLCRYFFLVFHRNQHIVWIEYIRLAEVGHHSRYLECESVAFHSLSDRVFVAKGFGGKRLADDGLVLGGKYLVATASTDIISEELEEIRVNAICVSLEERFANHKSWDVVGFTNPCPLLYLGNGGEELLCGSPCHTEIVAGAYGINLFCILVALAHTVFHRCVGSEDNHKAEGNRQPECLDCRI